MKQSANFAFAALGLIWGSNFIAGCGSFGNVALGHGQSFNFPDKYVQFYQYFFEPLEVLSASV